MFRVSKELTTMHHDRIEIYYMHIKMCPWRRHNIISFELLRWSLIIVTIILLKSFMSKN